MKVAIHQPHYLPWLGYFDKLDSADCFILLDTVQFKKHEWQNRNRIWSTEGWQWLTVPIIDRFPERIDCVRINPRSDWQRKHCQALRQHYGRSPVWEPLGPELLSLLERPWGLLSALNMAVIELLCRHLGIRTSRVRASSFTTETVDPTDRLIDLCRAVGGTVYLAGKSGPAYMQIDRFARAGIELRVHAYTHPIYPQRREPFVSHLAVIDLLFNCGPQSLEVLRQGRSWQSVSFSGRAGGKPEIAAPGGRGHADFGDWRPSR